MQSISPMKLPASAPTLSPQEGEGQSINSELWHACAGPLVSLPNIGSRVVYFPQGHTEQVAASTQRQIDAHIPNYPSLPPQLICHLHNVTLHADIETDEVYAQLTLQPINIQEREPFFVSDVGTQSQQPANFFCKTLTASDTSTHGGFSVPRRAAEKVFPPLDFTQQPPAQELIATDLHHKEWKFRHIYRGQPKRHLLTTGWSVFVSAKRLTAGDSVLFIRNEKGQLLLGIRRANRPQNVMPLSVISSDSMHIGVLAAAAHAATTNSCFTVFYNPRASPSEFVIPLSKYEKAVCHTRVSIGMRFRMLFETEESTVRRYMGTITSISDLDPVRWPNSNWRSLKVGWDESTAGERQKWVSLWEIEPLTTLFVYPPTSNWRLKRPWPQMPSSPMSTADLELDGLKRPFMWTRGGQSMDGIFPGLTNPWAPMQRIDTRIPPIPPEFYSTMGMTGLPEIRGNDALKTLTNFPQQSGPPQPMYRMQCQTPLPMPSLPLHNQSLNSVEQNGQVVSTPQQLQTKNNLPQATLPQEQNHCQTLILPPKLPDPSASMPPVPSVNPPPTLMPSQQASITELPPVSNVMPPLPSSYQSLYPLQGIFNSLPTDDHSLRSSMETIGGDHPRDAHVMDSWFPSLNMTTHHRTPMLQSSFSETVRSSAGTCSLEQTDSAALSGFSVPSLSSTTLPSRDYSPEQASLQVDVNNHLLFGEQASFGASDLPFCSGMLMNGELDDESLLEQVQALAQVQPATRTFTKVYKRGSVGRSLDVTRFSNYLELRQELARMFGLEGQLEDPHRSGWQLVYIDKENDILLFGDDSWEEFVSSVRCIKILSLPEVLQMTQEGMELVSCIPPQHQASSSSEECLTWQDPRNPSSAVTSTCSIDY